jgi:hypothetical protein
VLAKPRRPTFRWRSVPTASSYQLQVGGNDCGGPAFCFLFPEYTGTFSTTMHTPFSDLPLDTVGPRGTRYYWRVRACNTVGCGAWSSFRYFDMGQIADDVTGDGYADFIAGEPGPGGLVIHHGTSTFFSGPTGFGRTVAMLGDINGDGRGDFVAAGPDVLTASGAFFLYLGEPIPMSLHEDEYLGTQNGARFGSAIAAAGDVDGDGYRDFLVGEPYWDGPLGVDQGRVWLFYGGISVPLTRAPLVLTGPAAGAKLGYGLGGGGDIDADGYADFTIAAAGQGRIHIYRGGASPSVMQTIGPTGVSSAYGQNLKLGDVNGDGFADLIISDSARGNGASAEGMVWLYLASTAGTGFSAGQYIDSPNNQANALFGSSTALGDYNGDGRLDLLVGMKQFDNPETNEGSAWLFRGTATGFAQAVLIDNPSDQPHARFGSSVGFCDSDGDAYDELLVGAELWDAGAASNAGAAFVFEWPSGSPVVVRSVYGSGSFSELGAAAD